MASVFFIIFNFLNQIESCPAIKLIIDSFWTCCAKRHIACNRHEQLGQVHRSYVGKKLCVNAIYIKI